MNVTVEWKATFSIYTQIGCFVHLNIFTIIIFITNHEILLLAWHSCQDMLNIQLAKFTMKEIFYFFSIKVCWYNVSFVLMFVFNLCIVP